MIFYNCLLYNYSIHRMSTVISFGDYNSEPNYQILDPRNVLDIRVDGFIYPTLVHYIFADLALNNGDYRAQISNMSLNELYVSIGPLLTVRLESLLNTEINIIKQALTKKYGSYIEEKESISSVMSGTKKTCLVWAGIVLQSQWLQNQALLISWRSTCL